MRPFRKRTTSTTKTLRTEQGLMVDAITEVLVADGLLFYDQLSDNQVLGYANALWDFHCDLRDEWSRREMQKAADAK